MPQSNKSKKAKKGKISISHKDPTAHSKKRRIPHSSVGSKKSVKKLFNKTLSGTKKYDNIDYQEGLGWSRFITPKIIDVKGDHYSIFKENLCDLVNKVLNEIY